MRVSTHTCTHAPFPLKSHLKCNFTSNPQPGPRTLSTLDLLLALWAETNPDRQAFRGETVVCLSATGRKRARERWVWVHTVIGPAHYPAWNRRMTDTVTNTLAEETGTSFVEMMGSKREVGERESKPAKEWVKEPIHVCVWEKNIENERASESIINGKWREKERIWEVWGGFNGGIGVWQTGWWWETQRDTEKTHLTLMVYDR